MVFLAGAPFGFPQSVTNGCRTAEEVTERPRVRLYMDIMNEGRVVHRRSYADDGERVGESRELRMEAFWMVRIPSFVRETIVSAKSTIMNERSQERRNIMNPKLRLRESQFGASISFLLAVSSPFSWVSTAVAWSTASGSGEAAWPSAS